jgi:hypothetical protein
MDSDIVALFPSKTVDKAEAHVLGWVKSVDSGNKRVAVQVHLDHSPYRGDLSVACRQQQRLRIVRIDSILTSLRELDAVHMLVKHSLLPCILQGRFEPLRTLSVHERTEITNHAKSFNQLNDSQRVALTSVEF